MFNLNNNSPLTFLSVNVMIFLVVLWFGFVFVVYHELSGRLSFLLMIMLRIHVIVFCVCSIMNSLVIFRFFS